MRVASLGAGLDASLDGHFHPAALGRQPSLGLGQPAVFWRSSFQSGLLRSSTNRGGIRMETNRSEAAKKAAATRKRRAAGKKAWATRRRRAAALKAAATRKARSAARA